VTLALLLAAGPAGARQSPTGPESAEAARLEAMYGAANQATATGDHVTAAERYADVLDLLPESRENHESRALALLDSVAARRRAQAGGAPGAQLCSARDLVRDYLVTARATHGARAAELDGVRQAERVRDELDHEIAGLSDPTCPEDPPPSSQAPHRPPLQLAPAPAPGRDRRVVAGVALLGTGGLCVGLMALGLGLGARAEQAGREARAADPTRDIDDLLADGFLRRGQAGNRLAIAGGVLTGVTVIAGAVLLLLGKTRPNHAGARDERTVRRARAALLPGGVGLRF
jgi:hypothetical protein